MKTCLAFLLIFISLSLSAQQFSHGLFVTVQPNGNVVPVTTEYFLLHPNHADTLPHDSVDISRQFIQTDGGRPDTVTENGTVAMSTYGFLFHSRQEPLWYLPVYPVDNPETMQTYVRKRSGDTLFVHFLSSNREEYYISNWIYDANRSLQQIVVYTYSIRYRDTTERKTYNYKWRPDGKLECVTRIGREPRIYKVSDTLTTHMLYDKKGNLLAQVAYEGSRIDSLATSIEEWHAQIFTIINSSQDWLQPVDRNGVILWDLILYRYEKGLLKSSLTYSDSWSIVHTDTLEYDKNRRIIKCTSSDNSSLPTVVTFTYNKKGQILSKIEKQEGLDDNNKPYLYSEIRDQFFYGPDKRINLIEHSSYFDYMGWHNSQYRVKYR